MRPIATKLRCRCGNLMGCQTAHGLEVKCRRCKRIHLIPWSLIDAVCHPAQEADAINLERSCASSGIER